MFPQAFHILGIKPNINKIFTFKAVIVNLFNYWSNSTNTNFPGIRYLFQMKSPYYSLSHTFILKLVIYFLEIDVTIEADIFVTFTE